MKDKRRSTRNVPGTLAQGTGLHRILKELYLMPHEGQVTLLITEAETTELHLREVTNGDR